MISAKLIGSDISMSQANNEKNRWCSLLGPWKRCKLCDLNYTLSILLLANFKMNVYVSNTIR